MHNACVLVPKQIVVVDTVIRVDDGRSIDSELLDSNFWFAMLHSRNHPTERSCGCSVVMGVSFPERGDFRGCATLTRKMVGLKMYVEFY